MDGSRPGVRPSGFGVALLSFALTRLFVAETAQAEGGAFVSAALLPLTAGLGLTVYGIAIAIGAVSRHYARTVWRWTVLGTLAMLLVIVVTGFHVILLGERLGTLWDRSGILVANLLLVGDRAAKQRKTNERLVQYAERSMLVNRRLRHEILNAVAIVKGYATRADRDPEATAAAIEASSDEIERTVEHAEQFAATTGEIVAVDVGNAVE